MPIAKFSCLPAPVALAAAVIGLACARGAMAAPAADQSIVASLNPPPPGLSCVDAAAQTSVYFQFARPSFAVSQISLYLDGKGVPAEAVEQHWPTVTLNGGLHPGRNTVDLVAEGHSGQRLTRRLVVLVGPAAGGDAAAPATVACDDALAEGDEEEGPPEVIEEPPPVIVETRPPVIYQQPPVIYETAPAYVYRPYPTFALDAFVPLVPFFGFSFFYSNYHPYCPPPRVVYRPVPDHRWRADDHHGWRGGGTDWRGVPDRYDGRRGGGWTAGPDSRDPLAGRPSGGGSHTVIETGDEHRGGGRPQGPDHWQGHDMPGHDAPRGMPNRPVAPPTGGHSPQPQRWGGQSRGGGPAPGAPGGAPPAPRGGGHRDGEGGGRGGEHRHDNR